MNARELTKKYNDLNDQYFEIKRTVEYLEQEVKKLRTILEDMRVDVAQMSRR